MIGRATLRQIAEAVERHGGDLDDVRDLIAVWERLHGGIAVANALHNIGNERAAEDRWEKLAAEFARPLDDVVRDHLDGRQR